MRRHLEPGPDHPITIESKQIPVRILLAGIVVLDAKSHFELHEAKYPPAIYLPRDQINLKHLERSTHSTWCPYKGEASYFHMRRTDGALIENAVWTYESPFPAVQKIENALAVYASKVDTIEIG